MPPLSLSPPRRCLETDKMYGLKTPVTAFVGEPVDPKAVDRCVAAAQLMVGSCMNDIMSHVQEQSRLLQAELAAKLQRDVHQADDARPPLTSIHGDHSELSLPRKSNVRNNFHLSEQVDNTFDPKISVMKKTDEVPPHRLTTPLCWMPAPQPTDCGKLDDRNSLFRQVQELGTRVAASFNDSDSEENEPPLQMGKCVFANAASMKEKVRAALNEDAYNVMNKYYKEGFFQAIARSSKFEHVTLAVIAINALWIAVDTDFNNSQDLLNADPLFVVADNLFCTYFTVEIFIRFCAFERKFDALLDGWFCFDSVLVCTMILETWMMTAIMFLIEDPTKRAADTTASGFGNTSIVKIVRLARLTRMARLVRLLRAVPELIILIKGILVASRSVLFTLVLLLSIIYVFAIVFRQVVLQFLSPEDGAYVRDTYFSSVPLAMFSLLIHAVIPDVAEIVIDCSRASVVLGIIVLSFVLLASLTVMNMLVGVLCEVVSVVSSVEKEELTVSYVKSQLMQMIAHVAKDGQITQIEFDEMLMRPKAAKAMAEIGVDVVGLVDLSDFIFSDATELSFTDLIELVLQLRGSNSSTVKDLVDLRRVIVKELGDIQRGIARITPQSDRADLVESLGRSRCAAGLNESRAAKSAVEYDCIATSVDMCQNVSPFSVCQQLDAARHFDGDIFVEETV
eukprot:TRINITY_DN6730_c1_g1_i1.p1 TRINITY_DN6730_c1_g1~~TRINITY_DN6730_c1_g1_i1.p1  ORF type:complete len:725 (+),score=94.63 TRINITY_DN6730_c1_g1_i1:139-2175(+)